MGKSDWCSKCGNFMIFPNTHRCPPVWSVRMEWEEDDDWEEFHALDAEQAAEKFVERHEQNCADYPIAAGRSEAKVLVKGADTKITTLIVEGETVPNYIAREVAST